MTPSHPLKSSRRQALWIIPFVVLSLGVGIGFYRQLSHQFRQKETEIRSKLVRVEVLSEGQLVICNLDKKVGLVRLGVRRAPQPEFVELTDLGTLPADGCGVTRQFQGEISEFKALWENEAASRWETSLTYPKELHSFDGAQKKGP